MSQTAPLRFRAMGKSRGPKVQDTRNPAGRRREKLEGEKEERRKTDAGDGMGCGYCSYSEQSGFNGTWLYCVSIWVFLVRECNLETRHHRYHRYHRALELLFFSRCTK